jgi:hypothetical protein
MLQVFYLDVAYVTVPIYMLRMYVVNISSVSNVCCSKYLMLQVFHEKARQGGIGEGGPLGRINPCVRARSEVGAAESCIHGRGSRRGA